MSPVGKHSGSGFVPSIMHVLVIYNEPVLPLDHPDAESEREILDTAEVVRKHLVAAGHEAALLGIERDPGRLLDRIRAQRPDVVFNLFEGLADDYESEAYLAGLLEWLGVPFTGSPSQAMTLGRAKHVAKLLLKGAGLPTPDFFLIERVPVTACPLKWPVIVKPARQDASVGLDQGSVATDLDRLNERAARLLQLYGPPVLVEQFIRGREFNVGLIEDPDLRVLPLAEIVFVEKDPSYWPIITYDAKWKPGTWEYQATMPSYQTRVGPRLAERLDGLARQAVRLLGCRDYARVDFRVPPGGRPHVLEVNPNPDLSPSSGLAGGLAAAGISHAQFILDLVQNARARGNQSPRAPRKRGEGAGE